MWGARLAAVTGLGCAALLGWCGELTAQAPPPAAARRLTGTSFLVARYKAGSSASVYAARRVGAGMVVVGVVGNPRTGSWAGVLGAGTRVRLSQGAAVTVILGGAAATDGTSFRMYFLPSVRAGRIALTGTAAVYQPLTGDGRRQLVVDPLTLWVRVTGTLRTGLAAVVSASEGRPTDFGLGPCVELRAPGGILSLELVGLRRSDHPQLRTSFRAAL